MKESQGKEAFKKPILILGLAFVALGCTLGFSSLAWFASPQTSASVAGLEGEATGSYFSPVDGQTIADGSKEHPFGIQNAQQLYYFAWLQDMGYFNKDEKGATDSSGNDTGDGKVDTQYYFELMNDIDATGKILPPCGIEKYPFLGNFDAKNYTISNLTISNTLKVTSGDGYIEKHPLSTTSSLTTTEFENQAGIVGFFGIIGDWDGKSSSYATLDYDSSINEVKNLYLDNITIKTKKDNLLVGIFAGYANGTIDNCGVHYAKFDINGATKKIDGFSKVSEYSLIGSYNKTKFSWETTSGGSSGGDAGYGTSTDIRDLHATLSRFSLTDSSGNGYLSTATAIPFRPDANASWTVASGTTTVGGRTVTKASTVAVSSSGTNIGYYVGGSPDSTFDSSATMRVLKDHYASTTLKVDYDNISASTNSDVETVPDRVKTYLNKTVDSNGTIKQGDSVIKLMVPNILSYTMTYDSGYYAIENGKVGSKTPNAILVPNNCIWVAPQKSGTFEFVCVKENTASGVLAIWKLKRSSPLDYSSSLSTPGSTQYDNFTTYPNADFVGMSLTPLSSSATAYPAYYYGTPISDEDIENGIEFAITFYGNFYWKGPIYITYMDIGTDGGGSSGETTTSRTLDTTFDWVTKENNALTKIKNADGSEIAGNTYTKSNVFFEIGETDISRTFSWRRTTLDNKTLVLYYEQYTSTTVTAVMSAVGSGNNSNAKDGDCEAKAEETTT